MLQLAFVNFKQNSYILVEGTPATDRFFIIQSGKVQCYHETPVPGSAPVVKGPGDFVGVIPCMSGHQQTETIVALTNVVAIMVRRDQYPELIEKNPSIPLKIVRAFARDMRTMNDNLTKITLKKISIDSPEELYKIAKYYEDHGMTDIAVYAYYQYLKHCPTGINVEPSAKHFQALKPRSRAVYYEPSEEMMRVYPKGTMIFSEFQTGSDMFIIQDGSVRITKVVDGDEVTLALLKKGDMFGEMALLENKPRSASAIAHDDCKVMVINRKNFDVMVSTQAQLIAKLTTMFSDRLWSMYRQLVNTQIRDPREKMIDMLSLQVENKKAPYIRGMVFQTDFTPEDIMKFCGFAEADYEQLYNLLRRDQNVKLIEGKIAVPDVPELIRQASFYRKQNTRRTAENN